MAKMLATIAAVLLLAGCGGDDGGSVDRPQPSAEMEAMTLTIDDMPSGWAVDSSDDDGGDSPLQCTNETRALMADLAVAEASFVGVGDRPFFAQQIVEGGDRLARAVEIIDGCESDEVSVDRLSVDEPAGVDEFHAWRISVSADGPAIEGVMSVSRHGEVLMVLLYADILSVDLAEFGELADLAVAKLA